MGKKHGKKHSKKIISAKKFKIVDNLDTAEKRLEDRLFLMQMAMDEYDEYLGGTLERSVSWYLMCSWYGLSTMQSAILIARLATLLDASQSGHKWTPFVHARQGKRGLEIYARKNKSKREKGPAFDVAHIRMVMRSVMTKEKLEAITDEQVMRFARTLQSIAAREEEREAKNGRRDDPDSPGAVAFEDAKEYADPDALDDVDDIDDGIGDVDSFDDFEGGPLDSKTAEVAEDVGVLGETGPLNESAAAEGLSKSDDAENRDDESDDAESHDVHGKHAQSDDSLTDIPELKRLDLGKES